MVCNCDTYLFMTIQVVSNLGRGGVGLGLQDLTQHNNYISHGGQCVKELRIHVQPTTILYGGIAFNFFYMLSSCNFLLWVNKKRLCITHKSKLPIIPCPTVL